MQHGLLFHHLSQGRSGVDHEQIVCTLREALDRDAIRSAWSQVVARHPSLRARFEWEGLDEPRQVFESEVELEWRDLDWRDLDPPEQDSALKALLHEDRVRGFSLDRAPLMRILAVQRGEQHYELIWSLHHIIADGRSFPIVLREVFTLYDAARKREPATLATAPSYEDFLAWLAVRDSSGDRAYWRALLRGLRSPTHLGGLRDEPGRTYEAGARGELELWLSAHETERLGQFARAQSVTLGTLVHAAWALLLGRHSGEGEVLFGSTRAGRRGTVDGADAMVGVFINTLPVRARLPPDLDVGTFLQQLRAQQLAATPHEQTPLVEIQAESHLPARAPLFESIVIYDNALLNSLLRSQGGPWLSREFWLHEQTNYPLTLYAYGGHQLLLKLAFDRSRFETEDIERRLGRLRVALLALSETPDRPLREVGILTEHERRCLLADWNGTAVEYSRTSCVHELFEAQVDRTPDDPALTFLDEELSYRELDARANRLAHYLRKRGIGPDDLVGVCLERSIDMVVTVLAVQKAGAAYLPLDPGYPRHRVAFMLEDAAVRVLVTQASLRSAMPEVDEVVCVDSERASIARESAERPRSGVRPQHLAYVIYTSGSTGRPKGVMVEHRNVVNFFTGMDECVRHEPPGVWLAVTSLSFDISVLELFWTLARGFKVVLYDGGGRAAARAERSLPNASKPMDFGLFYFAADEAGAKDKYRLLIEGARFADRHGFASVWTPERHFHSFGGLYPNPSVTGAALAVATDTVSIRAGSVVLPLHNPIRVAEEWAVVDNLSRGRAGVSFASGWQPNDFVLAPHNYEEAKKIMRRDIATVRRLWRGEAVAFRGPDGGTVQVRTLPRPVQAELPVWITTAGSLETYRLAGEVGANILTHLLGQTIDELADRIRAYRKAWHDHGHGGAGGYVSLMLHTFVGDDVDSVRDTVREPMIQYLATAASLIRNFVSSWTAFKRGRDGSAEAPPLDLDDLSPEETRGLLEYSFERYFDSSALFGSPERCLALVDALKGVGVDEIAALIDFGVETEVVLEHLGHLDRVRELAKPRAGAADGDASLAGLIRRHGVTHLQCTPSMARMFLEDPETRAALGKIETLLIGGEQFPATLAAELAEVTSAQITNMYGPTETTIWSSTHVVESEGASIPIGRPIANTDLYILDSDLAPMPIGSTGELFIGGEGVVRGYLGRPGLTAERFIRHPFRPEQDARLYRSGDLARYRADGTIELLGRVDEQVKIRGHRIELGEIETLLREHPGVRDAVVVAREDAPGDQRLVAYVIGESDVPSPAGLRSVLAERLPEYMLPTAFVPIAEFPLTPNQKVDRKALPAPTKGERPDLPPDLEPPNAAETSIINIWRDVLRAPEVGRDQNFFELGGHSLLAVKTHRRLREVFDSEFRITDLFRYPTVRTLAAFLTRGSEDATLDESRARAAMRRESMQRRRRPRRQARHREDPPQ